MKEAPPEEGWRILADPDIAGVQWRRVNLALELRTHGESTPGMHWYRDWLVHEGSAWSKWHFPPSPEREAVWLELLLRPSPDTPKL